MKFLLVYLSDKNIDEAYLNKIPENEYLFWRRLKENQMDAMIWTLCNET